jgi:prolyl-tRNA synthetase
MEEVHTPDMPGIALVANFLGVEPSAMLKCIAFEVDGQIGLALVPGDDEVNEYALGRALAPRSVRLLGDDDFAAHPELPKGYIGPHHPSASVVVADEVLVTRPGPWVTGANRVDHHVRNALLGRDFNVDTFAPLATVTTGDACPRCGAELSVDRGIEVGHVFQLGTKYAEALGALYTDESGEQHPMVMGCYGIGVSRVIAAVAEEHHDEHGLAWPRAIAPFDVHVVALPGRGDAGASVVAAAEQLCAALEEAGVDVLYDDRDASPGVKFADADLLGMPVVVVIGRRLTDGYVEVRSRIDGSRSDVPLDQVAALISHMHRG